MAGWPLRCSSMTTKNLPPLPFWKFSRNTRLLHFARPPTIFRFLIREDLSKYDLSALEWCTIAGEALNPEVYDKFLALTGIKLREGYGQSETTLTIFTSPWVTPKPGSMGLPNPHYDIDLLTAEGASCSSWRTRSDCDSLWR